MGSDCYDVIVVGAGVEGLATARYLAKTGTNVLLLEQYPWPHNRGSSFGTTRIIRHSYSEPKYGAMMPQAFREWSQLERETGTFLHKETGILVLMPRASKQFQDYSKNKEVNKLAIELLDENELKQRFTSLNVPQGYAGTFEQTGGLLFANKAVAALMKSFIGHGGTFHDSEPLVDVSEGPSGNGVTVLTKKGSYRAQSVVLTMGPWAPKFLKEKFDMPLPIEPQKTVTCYWRVTKPGHYSTDSSRMPAVLAFMPDGKRFFFKPSLEYEDIINLGLHMAWQCDPNCRDYTDILDQYLKECRRFGSIFTPHVDLSNPALVEYAMYTENLFDSGFVLDRVPGHTSVVVGTGFSGHGFKLAPMVGTILGDLALGRNSAIDLKPFSINRFPKSSRL